MLTHIDKKNGPTMVDVSSKERTKRRATATSSIQLPEAMRSYFNGDDFSLKKGPVFHTAIIAGTMAVKKTHEMIPFCHQIPIESCKFNINVNENLLIQIECTVKTSFKTGVEMEALHGASIAALTIYDMCKAVSHEMTIGATKLAVKTGGKSNVLQGPLYGLVLTGGKSERMKEDKALLQYKGGPHAKYLYDLLSHHCDEVYLSARSGQWDESELAGLPMIEDSVDGSGPIVGMLSAFNKKPEANWIVLACDLPFLNSETINELLNNYDPNRLGVAFKNVDKGFAEPLCALYTPKARKLFEKALKEDIRCPVKVLKETNVLRLDQKGTINLANANTPEEFKGAKNEIN